MKERGVSRGLTLLQVFLVGLAAVYLLQIYSPLRLNTDAINYLSRATSITDGREVTNSHRDLPIGYTYMVAALDAAGLAASWTFTALNCLFAAIGLAAAYVLLIRDFLLSKRAALAICCLTLLSFVMAKYVAIPGSDFPFFGLTYLSLFVLHRAERSDGKEKKYLYSLAAGLIIVSIAIRSIGIALLPAILWYIWRDFGSRSKSSGDSSIRWFNKPIKILPAAIAILCVLLAAGILIAESGYLTELSQLYDKYGVRNNVSYMLSSRLTEWGELLLNVPESRIPIRAGVVVRSVGAVALVLLLAGLYRRRSTWTASDIFLSSFVLFLFVYPGHATRYWIPLLPLLIANIRHVIQPAFRYPPARVVIVLYLAGFTLAGLGALAYTTSITFAGSQFPHRYGDGTLESTYQAAFAGRRDLVDVEEGEIHKEAEEALELLYRYEPRAKPAPDR